VGAGGIRGVFAALCAAGVLAACVEADVPPALVAPVAAPARIQPAPAPLTTTVPAAAPEAPAPAPPAPTYLPPGVHEQQVEVDGHIRRWLTVVPPGANGTVPPGANGTVPPDAGGTVPPDANGTVPPDANGTVPPDAGGTVPTGIVIALHGVGGRGADMRSIGLEPLAAAQRVVVAYPDALGGAWNDGRPGADPVLPGAAVDDIRFLRLLIEQTAAATGAGGGRVAVVGFSNGAVMAGRVACDLADGVAAVALVAGTAGQGFERSCRPAAPLAVLVVAGSGDRIVPYAGGRVPDWGVRKRGFVAGVDDFVAFWRAQSGCASSQPVPAGVGVSAVRGVDCRAGAGVVRYRVNGGGHEWFRPPALDTTSVIWDFLARRFSAAT
jgi:polyhydroxybutyrate depolymerase